MSKRFNIIETNSSGRYSIGVDTSQNIHFLAIPVANRLVDYEEYYSLSQDEYENFLADDAAASSFAEQCRRREMDARLILQPGSDRGAPI